MDNITGNKETSMEGSYRAKLFKHIDHPEVFPNIPNIILYKIHHLWMGFWRLITTVTVIQSSLKLISRHGKESF